MCIEAFNTDDSLSLESPINAVCESIFLELLVISRIPSSLSVSVTKLTSVFVVAAGLLQLSSISQAVYRMNIKGL